MEPVLCHRTDSIAALLGVPQGLTAIVGGGGKTTLMYRLAGELSHSGRVIVTTTTHIFSPEGIPVVAGTSAKESETAFRHSSTVCVGQTEAGSGKLVAGQISVQALSALSDYVLIEADGARRLPLKAPAEHEPVIPEGVKLVIAVAGLDGIGKSVADAAFRPERYAELIGKMTSHRIGPADVAAVLVHPNGQRKGLREQTRFAVLLNKADTPDQQADGEAVARLLDASLVERVLITSLQKG